jgi:hypothetical protein
MSLSHTTSEQFACGYRIDFSDGGGPEGRVLHIGSLEECERMARVFPGVAYSGSRPNPRAFVVVAPYPQTDESQLKANDPLCAHGVSLFAHCESCALVEANHGDQS